MSYEPSVAVHPGLTVARELDAIGETQKWLADRTGLSEKQISQIIGGLAPITAEMAIKLEYALGGSANFWVKLNSNYLFTKEQQEL
ncbi:MAG: HigA family addiction module antitoxin [Coriobacteriia bacterium]|nr:HigA family addiction module antitoxin [Coriobacteriia bacterium]